MGKLKDLHFDNTVLHCLPLDASRAGSVRQVGNAVYALVDPTPLSEPRLVAASDDALALLGLDAEEAQQPEFLAALSGNTILPGSQPAAHCYCGYQFGYFAGQLGDGAAIYLGEVVVNKQTPLAPPKPQTSQNNATKEQRWELQLKGAGLTPFSRQADGRKVLRSSLREFLASEALAGLGIPTTRAGSLVVSGKDKLESCAVVSRIAQTFLRFGSFEICKATDTVTSRAGPSVGLGDKLIPQLVGFTIRSYFPHIWKHFSVDTDITLQSMGQSQVLDMVETWYCEVCRRTAQLVASWQSVGFVHGVLNTDNMSITGLTIDYGPYGFMDRFSSQHVSNGSDDGARYTYAAQPEICRWNCERLAEALEKVAVPSSLAAAGGGGGGAGVDGAAAGGAAAGGAGVVGLLPGARGRKGLAAYDEEFARQAEDVPGVVAAEDDFGGFLPQQLAELASPAEMVAGIKPTMPLENVHMMLMLAGRDAALLHQLGTSSAALQQQLAQHKARQAWASTPAADKAAQDKTCWRVWLKRYVARLQQEADAGLTPELRASVMAASNPRLVLRNWIAQAAIAAAEGGNDAHVQHLLQLLRDPYAAAADLNVAMPAPAAGAASSTRVGAAEDGGGSGGKDDTAGTGGSSSSSSGLACPLVKVQFDGKPPAWAAKLCVTCSS
eukprot:gene2537-2839_t